MAKQLKLKDLYAQCARLMKEGHGEKYLIVSDDNEGNGYHGAFFALTKINEEDLKYIEDLVSDVEDECEENLLNAIIVG